jgi:DNA repair photolyase
MTPCDLRHFDYQVDPYIGCEHRCHYCYVLNQAETDWTKSMLIHKDIVSQLRDEMEGMSPQTIYMGYHTDPYQPCETQYRQTRKVLELLVEEGFSASILTKSDLVVRDMDILKEMGNASVSVSIAFNDNLIRQEFEANTIDTETRIEALPELRASGIKTGGLICPVIPYITEVKPLIDLLSPHTDRIWIYGLSVRKPSDRYWVNLQGILARSFPKLKGRIEKVVFRKDHPYWLQLRQDLRDMERKSDLNLNICV